VADWNTLSAAIRGEPAGPDNNVPAPQFPTTPTTHRALAYARQRKHQYATLEHLLLALIDDVDAYLAALVRPSRATPSPLLARLRLGGDPCARAVAVGPGPILATMMF
jgi:ATP-dependent Clp protease ATP-binding subunit ClpA